MIFTAIVSLTAVVEAMLVNMESLKFHIADYSL